MAFTGTAVVKKISDKKFRVTGLSLAGNASGSIGFVGKTVPAEVSLTAPEWQPYVNGEGTSISLADAIEVFVGIVTDVTTPVPISVSKGGSKQNDFSLTFHNDTAATTSPELELYIEFH